ncbi:MAG: molybdopterin synthase sulfur carrier subunit [Cyclobacteriaceae bacterium]|nr:MAG: molybdopterin synthase sulfur carrier subunit [Cyclobacteriaceae bacterium]
MPLVNFTYALKRFYPDLKSVNITASNIAELVQGLDKLYPGLKDYLVDEQGRLRQHVNIFNNGKLIKDKQKLSDTVADGDEVFIMQALSGG